MEEEERLIRMLRGLNVLPLVVCFLIGILLIGIGKGKELLLFLIPLFCIISYFLIYFIDIEESKNMKTAWIFSINLISTTFWLVIFSALSAEMLKTIDIMPILLSIFIIGYPLWMLYYNFRLFMNEISKPSWHADDADGSPLRCSTADFYGFLLMKFIANLSHQKISYVYVQI
ncbi:hypothetical protein [Emticicia sp. W12TSBA100-4]|uniref:hypothetical protein n=1 Tax=Emticicia sp. W12TSBA100-4 TaxID=3160965 RepID=UPI00330646FE